MWRVDNAMVPRLGGPMGRHAQRRGVWFNPLPWAVGVASVLFAIAYLRHLPCLQTDIGNEINSYIRVCYSDIQSTFLAQGFGLGNSPLAGDALHFSPLAGVAMLLSTQAARLTGSVGATVDDATRLDTSLAFFAWTAVGLFVCLLITVVCFAWLGRRRGRNASWDAMLLAASPIVLAVGLVDWTLLPLAFTVVGLLQLQKGRLFEAGVVLGLAACAGTMPIAVVLAVLVATGLRRGAVAALKFTLPAVITWVGVHLPLMMTNLDSVYGFYHQEIHKETGYGSVWYLFQLGGLGTRHTGSLAFIILVLVLGIFVAYLYLTGKRPRVGSLIAVVILLTVVLGPAFPPQTSLWVLLAVLLARPYRPELIAVSLTEVGYYLAIWGWLGGSLTSAQQGPYLLYWLAVILRVAVELWVLLEAVLDIARPRRDVMRTPDVPDPIGGVLNRGEEKYPLVEAAHAA